MSIEPKTPPQISQQKYACGYHSSRHIKKEKKSKTKRNQKGHENMLGQSK